MVLKSVPFDIKHSQLSKIWSAEHSRGFVVSPSSLASTGIWGRFPKTGLKNKTVRTKSASSDHFIFYFFVNRFKTSHLTYNFSCGPFESGTVAWLTFDKPVWSWQHWSVVYLIWSEAAYSTKKGLSYCFEKHRHVNCRAQRTRADLERHDLHLLCLQIKLAKVAC